MFIGAPLYSTSIKGFWIYGAFSISNSLVQLLGTLMVAKYVVLFVKQCVSLSGILVHDYTCTDAIFLYSALLRLEQLMRTNIYPHKRGMLIKCTIPHNFLTRMENIRCLLIYIVHQCVTYHAHTIVSEVNYYKSSCYENIQCLSQFCTARRYTHTETVYSLNTHRCFKKKKFMFMNVIFKILLVHHMRTPKAYQMLQTTY